MKPDTPLTEVALHLPTRAAASLLERDPAVQSFVLMQVRAIVVFLEAQEIVFDPVAYEAVLDAHVATLTPMAMQIQTTTHEVIELKRQLAGAEFLVKSMSETIALMAGQQEQP